MMSLPNIFLSFKKFQSPIKGLFGRTNILMATRIPAVEFSREGYKIRKVFG
jgi:hypothetical protein